jgi:hypothetical protein
MKVHWLELRQEEEEKLLQQGKKLNYHRKKLEKTLFQKAQQRVIAVSNQIPIPDNISKNLIKPIAIPMDSTIIEDESTEDVELEEDL